MHAFQDYHDGFTSTEVMTDVDVSACRLFVCMVIASAAGDVDWLEISGLS